MHVRTCACVCACVREKASKRERSSGREQASLQCWQMQNILYWPNVGNEASSSIGKKPSSLVGSVIWHGNGHILASLKLKEKNIVSRFTFGAFVSLFQ